MFAQLKEFITKENEKLCQNLEVREARLEERLETKLGAKFEQQLDKKIEELKKDYTIVIVTHNMQQAARISDDTAFFLNGVLVEYSETKDMFTAPQDKRTEDYITGRFG